MTVAPMFRTDNNNPAPMFGSDGKPLLCDTEAVCCDDDCTIGVGFTELDNNPFIVKWQVAAPFLWTNPRWTFDDGQTSTEASPVITFNDLFCHTACVLIDRAVTRELCKGCGLACPTIGSCLEPYTNISPQSVFSVSVSGYGSNNNCDECPDIMNGTKILTIPVTGGTWRWSSGPFCFNQGFASGSVQFTPCFSDDARMFINAGRIDNDGDGTPGPESRGSVHAFYSTPMPPPPIWPSVLTFPRTLFNHDPDGGPCTLDSPISLNLVVL